VATFMFITVDHFLSRNNGSSDRSPGRSCAVRSRQKAKTKAGANFRLRQFGTCKLMHSGSRRGCFYAARFLAAHLFFIASLIRLRAAGDKWRFAPLFDRAGRPGPRFRPCKAVIAALKRSRSASNASMIVAVSMLLLGDKRMHQLYMRDQSFGYGPLL
jgi:hypothetical protein